MTLAIAALRLDARGYRVKAVTFGQPKATNEAGARRSAKVDLVRSIHGRDLVAPVPPADWRPGEELGALSTACRRACRSGKRRGVHAPPSQG